MVQGVRGGGNNFNEGGHFFKEAVLYIDVDYTQCNIPDHATSNFKVNPLRDKLRDMLHRVTVPKEKNISILYSRYNVSFVAVNDRADHQISILKRIVKFPVYQDTTSWNLWSKLGGGKDHFLIFDKCGRLFSHMKRPDISKFFKKAW